MTETQTFPGVGRRPRNETMMCKHQRVEFPRDDEARCADCGADLVYSEDDDGEPQWVTT
jgi:hypothetical protein